MEEIKVGDKVRVSKDVPKLYTDNWSCNWLDCDVFVNKTEGDASEVMNITDDNNCFFLTIPSKYLTKVNAEPKEPKFKVGDKCLLLGELCTVEDVSKANGREYVIMRDSDGFMMCAAERFLKTYTEPTSPKIKVGDKVRHKNPLRHKNSTDNDFVGVVIDVENRYYRVYMSNGAIFQTFNESDLELVQPKEQTEADANEKLQEEFGYTPISFAERIERDHIQRRMKVLSQDDFLKEFNPAEHEVNPKTHYTKKNMSDTEFWVKYEAVLAKEIAVKLAGSTNFRDAKEKAAYVVQYASEIVENLKKRD